jgi:hypothetical protein
MDVAYVSAFAALAGSVIGGLTSLMTSWLVQRTRVPRVRSHGRAVRRFEQAIAIGAAPWLDRSP